MREVKGRNRVLLKANEANTEGEEAKRPCVWPKVKLLAIVESYYRHEREVYVRPKASQREELIIVNM